ncbi:hypothetical protein TW81_11410 [Vibrio galatheae]|uniref:Uncharacterized protein n=1 Tax=Vibrio galatheae TaxID=579748 RepID=A0A0F4NI54_9VIBR|nr:hypothetical protein [Vibrio galatheae]KJY82815.1 hypothetical protein TW81_11410 [Vibrio galatheae]
MKWHNNYLIIAAALLITLPCKGNSVRCNADSWNHALKHHQEIEQEYNFHATRFNTLLQAHRIQPFLYQEFSREELQGLWLSPNSEFHKQMQTQIEASLTIIEQIQQEKQTIARLTTQAEAQSQLWRAISEHCRRIGEQSNVIISWNYAELNQALTADIEEMIQKLIIIESRYTKEIEALENAKPKPLQNQE